ncbi:hypothetical protein AVEN_72470-1 [Araneus ventricosus]|uniref:C2H2-type domain-containing protein n=1 Tax=Araneus ventricosus TaxID=182803 RepID=A0A4Y2G480_ARAVE|nr:hypothetical protein AVEN_72470-1 [Araneus ventricosus]
MEAIRIMYTREKKTFSCEHCDQVFPRISDLLRLKRTDHSAPPAPRVARPPTRKSGRNALGAYSSHFMMPNSDAALDLLLFLEDIRQEMHDIILPELEEKRSIKCYYVSKIRFSMETPVGDAEYCSPYFRNKVVIELDISMIAEHIEQAFDKVKLSLNDFLKNGSVWVFDSVISHMEIKTATYHLLAPRSYIPLPSKLAAKKALINIKNVDKKCLVWCVLAALYLVELYPERVSHYLPLQQELRLGNVTCLVQSCKDPTIEKLNNLRINVFGYEDEEVFPLYISKREDNRAINLLYITQGDGKHY